MLNGAEAMDTAYPSVMRRIPTFKTAPPDNLRLKWANPESIDRLNLAKTGPSATVSQLIFQIDLSKKLNVSDISKGKALSESFGTE